MTQKFDGKVKNDRSIQGLTYIYIYIYIYIIWHIVQQRLKHDKNEYIDLLKQGKS